MDADIPSSFRTLYYQWEREQWSAGEIDLTEDRRQWDGAISEESKRSVVLALGRYRMHSRGFEELVALADKAATEDQQIFVTAQLADAARHAVFFDRYSSEVTGDLEQTNDDAVTHDAGFEVDPVLSELGSLIDFLDTEDLLPGLREGLTAMARDDARHRAFATMLRREASSGPDST
jgi:hypothetical protein